MIRIMPNLPKRKVVRTYLGLVLLLSPAWTQAMPFSGAFPDYSEAFKNLPPYIQAEIESPPRNSVQPEAFRFPPPPQLIVNVMEGADWRLNDGYGFWLGDGQSPLATAADYSAYDKAQTTLYLKNRQYFSQFDEAFRKEAKQYAATYAKAVAEMVKRDKAYQNLLLTYPDAVTRDYVLLYLENRDSQLGLMQRNWETSVSHIRYELSDILGQDLNALTDYNSDSGMDAYVRNMNKQLVNSERSVIDNSWAPMTTDALAPLKAFQPHELTVAEAEKMQWGVPPVVKAPEEKMALPNTPFSERQSLAQAYHALINPSNSASKGASSWLGQILALILLIGGGGWWWLRRKKNQGDAPKSGAGTE